MTIFYKPQVIHEEVTNINNINNNNNTNNDFNYINFTICDDTTNSKGDTPAGASGLASLSRLAGSPGSPRRGVLVDPSEKIPELWRGLKIDIINNAPKGQDKLSLKIKFGIIKKDSTTQSILANLNSPNSYLWRRVPELDRSSFHWTTVKNIQDRFDQMNIEYRASKCVLPHNTGTTEMVCFFCEDENTWITILVREGQQYNFFIDKNSPVTAAQRTGNIIASKFIGQQVKPLLTCKELGI